MLTSCMPEEDVAVKRRGKDLMGGVDRSDQMMSSYPMERKRLKKWSKKMWLHLINRCVFNAHILHKKQGGNLSPLEFRSALISQLVEKFGYDKKLLEKEEDLVQEEILFGQQNNIFLAMFLLQKKIQMLNVDVLYVKNMGPEKKVDMNVQVVTQDSVLPLVLEHTML